MSDIKSTLPVTDSADGVDGTTAPSTSIQIAGKDPNGNLQAILTDINGVIKVTEKVTVSPNSPTVISVGIATTVVLASNTSRTGLMLINTSSSKISLGLGVSAVLNSGITLYPGGTFWMDSFSYTTVAINAIASVASSNLSVQEFD